MVQGSVDAWSNPASPAPLSLVNGGGRTTGTTADSPGGFGLSNPNELLAKDRRLLAGFWFYTQVIHYFIGIVESWG